MTPEKHSLNSESGRPATEVQIGNRTIGPGCKPYVIAEAGSNFNQDLDTAFRLIDAAAAAKADMVKFQLFRADALYPADTDMHALFKAVELNPDWVGPLAAHAREQGLEFTASVFDAESADVLETIDVPAHKIASSEITNAPLLAQIAETGRPLIVSTGMCDIVDVHDAVALILGRGNDQIILLQCGSMYPLPPELANIQTLDVFSRTFGCPVGFSDHTLGFAASIAAVARGATVIEKHFTLDREAKGPDHFYALESADLIQFVDMLHEAHASIGDGVKVMLPAEREAGRRDGLYAARDIAAGEMIELTDIEVKRPALGLRPRHLRSLVGARARSAICVGDPLKWESICW